jgi:predicted transcriptional regulator
MNRFMRGAFALAAIAALAFIAPAAAYAADLTITAASVLPGSSAQTATGVAGEALTAGQAVYRKVSDGKFYKADCNSGTAEVRVASAIALTGSAAGQSVVVQTGGQITIGATLTAGVVYYLSGTAGGIRPVADNTTGDYPQVIGMAMSTTSLLLDFKLAAAAAL